MRPFYLAVLATIFSVALVGLVPSLRGAVVDFSFSIKRACIDKWDSLSDLVYKYVDQTDKIENLVRAVDELKKENSALLAIKQRFITLQRSLQIKSSYDDPSVQLLRVLSYASFASYTKIWIDYDGEVDTSRFFGLIKDGYAIGITRFQGNKLLGLLNGDKGSSYSVYVGQDMAPGVATAGEGGKLIVDFIPSWMSIKEGDEVITSGLDGVFYEGVKVGVVTSVIERQGYFGATVESHRIDGNIGYVWVVDTKIPQSINLGSS